MAAGRLGRKTGGGFYRHEDGRRMVVAEVTEAPVPDERLPPRRSGTGSSGPSPTRPSGRSARASPTPRPSTWRCASVAGHPDSPFERARLGARPTPVERGRRPPLRSGARIARSGLPWDDRSKRAPSRPRLRPMSTMAGVRTGLFVVVSVAVMSGCVAGPGESGAASPSLVAGNVVSPRPSPTQHVSPTATPLASWAPSTRALRSAAPSGAPTPSSNPPHEDPVLEAMLPSLLSRTALTRFSTPGSYFTGGSDSASIAATAKPLPRGRAGGVRPRARPRSRFCVDALGIGMIAYRARGQDRRPHGPERDRGLRRYGGLHTFPPPDRAGRPATYLDAGMGISGEYLMTRHDVLFIVLGQAPGNDTCHPGSCASRPPEPWPVPAYVTEALGGVP